MNPFVNAVINQAPPPSLTADSETLHHAWKGSLANFAVIYSSIYIPNLLFLRTQNKIFWYLSIQWKSLGSSVYFWLHYTFSMAFLVLEVIESVLLVQPVTDPGMNHPLQALQSDY